MSIRYGSKDVFKDLGFNEGESVDLQFKADLYVLLIKTIEKKKFSNRDLEKIWDIPQPRVSELMTGKLEKVSISRLLNFLAALGIRVTPVVDKGKKSA